MKHTRPLLPDSVSQAIRPSTTEQDSGYLGGQLLIAMPTLGEPPFAQSVVYVCAHNPDGAMGLVLNQPLREPSFDDLLRQLDIEPLPPARRIRLCSGGPLDAARGFVLHSTDWNGDGSMKVGRDISLTASLDVLKAIASGGGPRETILALGYAGWGPGQLDQELQTNVWLSAPAHPELVFSEDYATKWRQALASLHVDPLMLSPSAGHA